MNGKTKAIICAILTFATIASCTPQPAAERTPASELIPITVYFTDTNRYAAGTPPFEVAVGRMVPSSSKLAEAVLLAFFEGPTAEEREQGLEAIKSGFNGVDTLII